LSQADHTDRQQKVLAVASGEKTKSEEQGYGENRFVLWVIGAMM